MTRANRRTAGQLRPVKLTTKVQRFAEGSCLIEWGETRVICTASVEDKVPHFLRGTGRGWLTAEYGMLPRSTTQRMEREVSRGKLGGRTQEIQRLIGRSLRAVVDLSLLGERTIWIDCDVLQADGGTRCASITGAYVALVECLNALQKSKALTTNPLRDSVAAVSVGIVGGAPMLDLDYAEDSQADVDMNVIMTGRGLLVELQGTAERHPFDEADLKRMLGLARRGLMQLSRLQRSALPAPRTAPHAPRARHTQPA